MKERKDPYSVGAWMTENPETVQAHLPVRQAFFKMRNEGYRHLLVEDKGKLVGIVTDRDLRRPDLTEEPDGWNEYYNLDKDYTVRDVMTADVATVRSIEPLEKALRHFVDRKYGALPVLDKDGGLIGILTTHDALRAFQAAMAQAGESLRRK